MTRTMVEDEQCIYKAVIRELELGYAGHTAASLEVGIYAPLPPSPSSCDSIYTCIRR